MEVEGKHSIVDAHVGDHTAVEKAVDELVVENKHSHNPNGEK